MHLGATPFSIYNTSAPEQIAYLFSNAGNDVVIAERQYLERVRAAGAPRHVVCLDELEELEAGADPGFDFEAAWKAVEPDDVATLIYTSGTTGPPKGVELTHANLLAQCRGVARVLPMRAGARITSYLPSAHIADRWSSHYNQMAFGLQITSVADPKALVAVLGDLRPTVWGAVPRVVEKMKSALEAGIAGEPDDRVRQATQAAIETGIEKVRLEQAGEEVPAELTDRYAAADGQVLSKLRAKLGLDQAEWIIIGAAPLARDVHEFLLGIGLPVVELYGMSEAACVITTSHARDVKIGTVGRAAPGLELRLAGDGELLVRGPTVMRGYRHNPEKTRESVDDDGWLHTGDVAEIDDDGYVRIVDRKKEIIINAGGKNMSPANIEQTVVSAHPLIGQAIVIGDRRPYNVALLVLDPDMAAAHARSVGLEDASVEAVAADEGVKRAIAEAMEQANRRLSRVEQVKSYELLSEEWVAGGDELTPTMKLKRRPIAEKYGETIEALYAG
jgi:long-subunit acyl-CoA synthetase (AMP-forming)